MQFLCEIIIQSTYSSPTEKSAGAAGCVNTTTTCLESWFHEELCPAVVGGWLLQTFCGKISFEVFVVIHTDGKQHIFKSNSVSSYVAIEAGTYCQKVFIYY